MTLTLLFMNGIRICILIIVLIPPTAGQRLYRRTNRRFESPEKCYDSCLKIYRIYSNRRNESSCISFCNCVVESRNNCIDKLDAELEVKDKIVDSILQDKNYSAIIFIVSTIIIFILFIGFCLFQYLRSKKRDKQRQNQQAIANNIRTIIVQEEQPTQSGQCKNEAAAPQQVLVGSSQSPQQSIDLRIPKGSHQEYQLGITEVVLSGLPIDENQQKEPKQKEIVKLK